MVGGNRVRGPDDVLAELERTQPVRGVQFVPLAFHVDYWDFVALVQPEARVSVARGENAGTTPRHTAIVRALDLAGTVGRMTVPWCMPFVYELGAFR